MDKFTRGPWTAYDFGADWWVGTQADDSGPMLRVGSTHADREANAHLIAAAPDLYEIADLIERSPLEMPGAWRTYLKSALAKARGEA